MAASDILNLNNSMAPKAIKWLYWIALLLIALGVVMGMIQGVGVLNRAMNPRPAVTAAATAPGAAAPDAAAAPADANAAPGAQNRPPRERRFFSRREFRDFNMRRRDPVSFGALVIARTLVRGLIQLLMVRVLAELGLAVLAMGKRA